MAAPTQPDDFNIPPPSDEGNGASPEANTADSGFNTVTEVPAIPAESFGRTEMILGGAAILVLAGLLLFLRNAIRRSLIANRATIDAAGAAAWTWYFALLITGTLLIVGVLGGLLAEMSYILVTVGVAVIGLLFAYVMHNKARRSA
jgi:uncharacterized membrane protein